MYTLYGIKNCDTVKKALKWFETHGIEAELHDYRTAGIDESLIATFMEQFPWQDLVNKRSTTWRNLDANIKDNLSEESVMAVLLANPTLIKRPIILCEDKSSIGFQVKRYEALYLS